MPSWSGITLKTTPKPEYAARIVRCFEPFKATTWNSAFDPETFDADLVNHFELRDSPDVEPKAWTMLHYVASAPNAPVAIANKLIEHGASRCAKDCLGRAPFDIAKATGQASPEMLAELAPQYKLQGNCEQQLDAIEVNFHKLIRQVSCGLADESHLALPPVRALLETHYLGEEAQMQFAIPGMYGGFYNIHLVLADDEKSVQHLICESWCRVVGGSGRRDRVTAEGTELLESGFV